MVLTKEDNVKTDELLRIQKQGIFEPTILIAK